MSRVKVPRKILLTLLTNRRMLPRTLITPLGMKVTLLLCLDTKTLIGVETKYGVLSLQPARIKLVLRTSLNYGMIRMRNLWISLCLLTVMVNLVGILEMRVVW